MPTAFNLASEFLRSPRDIFDCLAAAGIEPIEGSTIADAVFAYEEASAALIDAGIQPRSTPAPLANAIHGNAIARKFQLPEFQVQAQLVQAGIEPLQTIGTSAYYDRDDLPEIEAALADVPAEGEFQQQWSDGYLAAAAEISVEEVNAIMDNARITPLFAIDEQRVYPSQAVTALRQAIEGMNAE